MKTLILVAGTICLLVENAKAQNWLTTGNAGLTASNFLGSTDAKPVIFKTNSLERGRIFPGGNWRFGSSVNYAQIDNAGVLSFKGAGGYLLTAPGYVFKFT